MNNENNYFWATDMNQLLILIPCTEFELNSLRNNGITMTLRLEAFLAVRIQ